MTLVEFLLARIAEDEEVARVCAEMFPPPWEVAECEAKRRVVELHHPDRHLENWYWMDRKCAECRKPWHKYMPGKLPTDIGPEKGCPTLRLLALPYVDHPDYDEAWRPEVTRAPSPDS